MPVDKNYVNTRPVAIMINNIEQAQPLLGISQADIMYECMVEGAITRIMAVFKNPYDIEMIGSVRSARPYFINIARGLDAIYVHVGGSTQALSMLESGFIDSFNLGNYTEMMWRDPQRRATLGYEHSAVTSGKRLLDGIKNSSYKSEHKSTYKYGQEFSENSQVLNGENCRNLKAEFSWYKNTVFDYNENEKTYYVSQFGESQLDGNSNVQNSKQNVLALYINTYSMEDSVLQEMDLIGTGEGYYMSRGKIIPIKWTKKSYDSPFVYKTLSGEDLRMLPGQCYVCCVPLSGNISYN